MIIQRNTAHLQCLEEDLQALKSDSEIVLGILRNKKDIIRSQTGLQQSLLEASMVRPSEHFTEQSRCEDLLSALEETCDQILKK